MASSKSSDQDSALTHLLSSPASVAIVSSIGTTALVFGGFAAYRRYWKRFPNADAIPGKLIEKQGWIKGVVTSVGDGDGMRVYHTPGPFFSYPFKFRSVPETTKELKDQTISIRIAGVDAPETAHFGRPAQPHAQESMDWLTDKLMKPRRRTVKCQIMRRDQYGRIVAVPYLTRFFLPSQPLPIEMLKHGMGTVYESAGAEYGPWGLDHLKSLEDTAKARRRGMWASWGKRGVKKLESPAEYKRRFRMDEGDDTAAAKATGKDGKAVSDIVADATAAVGNKMWRAIRTEIRRTVKKVFKRQKSR